MTNVAPDLIREAVTRWMTEWVASTGHVTVYPGMAPLVLRGRISRHVAPIPLPPGDRMEFVTRCIATTFELVDWDQGIRNLGGGEGDDGRKAS